MALPNSLNSAAPAGTDSPSLGDDEFRSLKTFLQDIFSIPDNTNIAAAGLDFVAGGLQTVIFQDAAANPATAGYFQRNATNLLFYDGTAARTVAFLERNQTFDPGSQSGTTSVQAVAGDLTLAAGYGSSGATAHVYAAGVMGNVISTANMTATQNMIAGVIGKYDLTGTNSSVLPKAGVIGEVGDNADTADAAVMAVLGGDTAATNPGAAFGVAFLNSTPASNFAFGLDLYRAAIGSYQAVSYGTAAIRIPNASWMTARNAAGSANVNLARINASNGPEIGGAGAAGTVLRSDGTVFTTSTATYPNAATSGGVLYASAANAWATSGALTANGVVYGGGAGVAPSATAQGGTRTILTANAGAPAWSAAPIVNTSVQIGVVSSTTGSLLLANSASANLTTLQAGNATEANTYVWPTDGGTSGQVLQTDGATPTTVLSWLTVSSVSAATQAEMETATSTTTYASPGRVQNHPGVTKTWVRFNSAGTVAASYNNTSVTDTGVGNWTVNHGTDMSGTNYASNVGAGNSAALIVTTNSVDAGTEQVLCFDTAGTAADATSIRYAALGDQ